MSDDPAFNIKFVELIEKYPCIYDYTRQDHSKRDVVEKAWNAVASKLNFSGKKKVFINFFLFKRYNYLATVKHFQASKNRTLSNHVVHEEICY